MGLFSLEVMDGYGNWVGSPVEFLKFLLAIDGQRGQALLAQDSFAEMSARPAQETRPNYYGLGFMFRPAALGQKLDA